MAQCSCESSAAIRKGNLQRNVLWWWLTEGSLFFPVLSIVIIMVIKGREPIRSSEQRRSEGRRKNRIYIGICKPNYWQTTTRASTTTTTTQRACLWRAPCYESPRLHPLCPSPSLTLNVISPVLRSFASRRRHWLQDWRMVGIYWAVMSKSKEMSLASACRSGSRPSCCDFLFLEGACGAVKSCYWHYHLACVHRERPILTLWRLGDVLDCLSDSLDSIGVGIWDLLCIR